MQSKMCVWAVACAASAVCVGSAAHGGLIGYQHDDGSHESVVAPDEMSSALFLNNFIVEEDGGGLIESIDVFWSSRVGDIEVLAGIWADPNGDGDPSDAILLDTAAKAQIGAAGAWQTFSLGDGIDVGGIGTSFFVGVIWQDSGSIAGAGLGVDMDYDGPAMSWTVDGFSPLSQSPLVAGNTDLADDSVWMIRANAIPEPAGALALAAIAGACGLTRRRRA